MVAAAPIPAIPWRSGMVRLPSAPPALPSRPERKPPVFVFPSVLPKFPREENTLPKYCPMPLPAILFFSALPAPW